MRFSALRLLALSSLLIAGVANGATRPQYGGSLHVAMRAAPQSLDPADPQAEGSIPLQNLSRMLFDTLFVLDDRGHPQPSLAVSWHAEPGNQRWQVILRSNVTFTDGSPLTTDVAAASLRAANPNWKVFPGAGAVIIETDASQTSLPAELALARNAIAKRESGKVLGTGPFTPSRWDPGKHLTLVARDEYWGGRPYLDSVEIELGRSFRDQMISFDLGKADLIEVAPEQSHRVAMDGRPEQNSSPEEFVGLLFTREKSSDDEGRIREALSASMDRASMSAVVLQGGGDPAGSLLPGWLSGYAFVFPTAFNLQHARDLRSQVRQAPTWTLSYDSSDPLSHVIAERVALNARDAGIGIQLSNSVPADIRLVRFPLASLDADVALMQIAEQLSLPKPKFGTDSSDDLYAAEAALLGTQRVIPLLHLRSAFAIRPVVKEWSLSPDGAWTLPNVWLRSEKP